MKKLFYGFIFMLSAGCGQEYWQQKLEEKILGEWNIDLITYHRGTLSDSTVSDVGTWTFTRDYTPIHPAVPPSTLPTCYYIKKGDSTQYKFIYQPQGSRDDNMLATWETIPYPEPLEISDFYYRITHISDKRMSLKNDNFCTIELSR
jgi:hypothetical protein